MSEPRIINDDDGLDDFFAEGFVHIERMGTGHWWIGVTLDDGRTVHVNLCTPQGSRTKVTGRAEVFDGPVSKTEPTEKGEA